MRSHHPAEGEFSGQAHMPAPVIAQDSPAGDAFAG